MPDGKLIFDTKVDTTGLREGLQKIKNVSAQDLGKAGSVFESTGAKLTKFITKPALAAGSALVGLSLVKGFNRLKNIDTAKAQLEGLGHSAKEVDAIMDSAMKSVKGTAYGFDEAATAAASAVAAGIKPGKDLTRYLGLVGDAAAQSKLSFTDMGSIFNKVMASGKISMEEVNQLADQGIPIYKMLSEQLGVTQADVRDMVSAGKVDSETFLNAIESNIGGAAKIMGEKSFTGALANIGASLGRIGANFLDAGGKGGGFFSQLKPLMAGMMDSMDKLEDKAADWGITFGKVFSTAVKIVKAMPGPVLGVGTAIAVSAGPILKMSGGILKTASAIKAFNAAQKGTSVIAGVLDGKLTVQQAALIKLGSGFKSAAAGAKSMVKGLPKAYGDLTAKIAALGKTQSTVNKLYGVGNRHIYGQESGIKAAANGIASYSKRLLLNAAATVKSTASTAANTVATKINGIAASGAAKKVLAFASAHKAALMASLGLVAGIAALAIYMGKSGKSAEQMAASITAFSEMLASMITGFANNLPMMIEQVLPAITQAVQALVTAIPALIPVLINAGITLFMALVDSLTQIIEPLAAALPQVIDAIIAALPVLIPALINAGVQLFMALVGALGQAIPALVDALPQIIDAIAGAIPVLIPALIQAAITLFMAFIQAIPQIASALIKAMPQIIIAIVTGLLSGIGQIFNVGIQLLKQLWQGISSWGSNLKSRVISFAKSIPGMVKSGLGSLASIGLNWIKGLWNGISDAKDWLIRKIKGLCSNAKDAIKDFFGIKSPSRLMAAIGKYIPMGLGVGIASKTKALVATAKEQMQSLKDAYSFDGGNVAVTHGLGARFVAPPTPADGSNAPAAQNYIQNNYFYRPEESPVETARALKNQNTFGLAGGWA